MASNIKGPGIFLAQFAGDAAPFNSLDAISQWAAGARLQGRADPVAGTRACSTSKKAASSQDLLRRARRHRRAPTASRSPSSRRICRASWSRCTRPTTRPSTPSRPTRCSGNPKARQDWAVEQMLLAAKASQQPRPEANVDFLGRAGLALSLSLAAAPAGPDRDRVRRARQALEADPRRLRRRGRRRRASSSIRARTCSTAPPSRCSSSASTTTRAAASTTTRRTSCCSSSTTSSSSTSTTSASRRSTSRTPSSTRPAGRASIRAIQPWLQARRALPLARRRPGRFRRRSSRSWPQYDYDCWAVLEWECA